MKLFNGDVVVLRDYRRGTIAGDIIAFVPSDIDDDACDYVLLEDYTDDYRHIQGDELDIMEVYRIDWGDDEHEGSREYERIWRRVDPRYMLKNGDIVTLRNERDFVVSGPYFVHRATYKVICWDDFTDDLLSGTSDSCIDVMVIIRNGKEIWRRD
jgi:hypothetical protein